MNFSDQPRLDRRAAIKWMLAAGAALAAGPRSLAGGPPTAPAAVGYGTDPLVNKEYAPGDFWPLTLTDDQRRIAAALCALIIPAEDGVPSAADLRVHDFIDEWISAPYPGQQRDRSVILEGLAWVEAEAKARFNRPFADLDGVQMAAIADDVCHAPEAKPEHTAGARFFARFRDLTAGGFFTTPEGMQDIGYRGNMPLPEFKGPPPEVLRKLGLA